MPRPQRRVVGVPKTTVELDSTARRQVDDADAETRVTLAVGASPAAALRHSDRPATSSRVVLAASVTTETRAELAPGRYPARYVASMPTHAALAGVTSLVTSQADETATHSSPPSAGPPPQPDNDASATMLAVASTAPHDELAGVASTCASAAPSAPAHARLAGDASARASVPALAEPHAALAGVASASTYADAEAQLHAELAGDAFASTSGVAETPLHAELAGVASTIAVPSAA